MKKANHHTPVRKTSAFSRIINSIKTRNNKSTDEFFADKNILQRLFHPDYILFDWEFFSRELEFE